MRIKVVVLGVVAVISLVLGAWLLVSPSLERQSDLAQQIELLENIMAALPETVCEYGLVPTPDPLDLPAFPESIIPLGILIIDAIDLRLPVMEGVGEPELRIAPGRVPQTARIGEIGNAVIAGHRNLTFGSMFNRLGEAQIGDIIRFQALSGEVMTFKVFEMAVITPDDQIAFIQPLNESIITLYTCTPIHTATHRLIVRARRINY